MPDRRSVASKKDSRQLELDDDLAFHRLGWKIQKIGWIVVFLLIALAAAGFFGTGPVSRQTVQQDGNEVKYEKFMRFESEAELIFKVTNVRDTLTLKVPQSYLAYVDVTAISPLPVRNRIDDNVITYYFAADGQATIYCKLMSKKPGSVNETMIVNNSRFDISHLIYP